MYNFTEFQHIKPSTIKMAAISVSVKILKKPLFFLYSWGFCQKLYQKESTLVDFGEIWLGGSLRSKLRNDQ